MYVVIVFLETVTPYFQTRIRSPSLKTSVVDPKLIITDPDPTFQ
jgi:hypothetical protein